MVRMSFRNTRNRYPYRPVVQEKINNPAGLSRNVPAVKVQTGSATMVEK